MFAIFAIRAVAYEEYVYYDYEPEENEILQVQATTPGSRPRGGAIYCNKGKTHGSVSVEGGYSREQGPHGGVSVTISWAKEQERKALIGKLMELEAADENKGELSVEGLLLCMVR